MVGIRRYARGRVATRNQGGAWLLVLSLSLSLSLFSSRRRAPCLLDSVLVMAPLVAVVFAGRSLGRRSPGDRPG